MLQRKIVTASLTSSLFAVLLGFIGTSSSFNVLFEYKGYFLDATGFTMAVLIYAFPAIMVYGTLTSCLSDLVAQYIERKTNNHLIEILVSLSLHLLFGLVLFLYSFIAAFLFFIIDRLLQKRTKLCTWITAAFSLLIPLSLFGITIVIINLSSM